ncbi:hypothetical protein [Bacteroides timonensis]|uniref:hypothetical protein n=1 Tax=Bacteroides timonensis TaxID=1470345 RepID=UPI001FCCA69A|nr:hypothetical protein [Bacteroides timonensis]
MKRGFRGRTSAIACPPAVLQIPVQPGNPSADVRFQLIGIRALLCRTMPFGIAAAIARQFLADNIGNHRQYLVLQQGGECSLLLPFTIMNLPSGFDKLMEQDVPVAFHGRKAVQPCPVGLVVGAERAAVSVIRCHCYIIFISQYFLYSSITGKKNAFL